MAAPDSTISSTSLVGCEASLLIASTSFAVYHSVVGVAVGWWRRIFDQVQGGGQDSRLGEGSDGMVEGTRR